MNIRRFQLRNHIREVIAALVAAILMAIPINAAAGDLDPTGPPAPTMRTLEQLQPTWDKLLPSSNRFEMVIHDRAVLDKETGVVWAISPLYPAPEKSWSAAINACANHKAGIGDDWRGGWRLARIEELSSLMAPATSERPANFVSGSPFELANTVSMRFWSSTVNASDASQAWYIDYALFGTAGVHVRSNTKNANIQAWCVRAPSSANEM